MPDLTKQVCDLSIREFIEGSRCSIRVSNALRQVLNSNGALEIGQYSFNTIKDFIEAGDRGYKCLLLVPNLGKKSASEFLKLVEQALNEQAGAEKVVRNLNEKVYSMESEEFPDLSIEELIHRSHCSTRLENAMLAAIKDRNWKYKTLKCFLSSGEQGRNDLRKIENMGSKTQSEFYLLIDKYISESSVSASMPKHREACNKKNGNSELERQGRVKQGRPNPIETIEVLLDRLTEKEHAVLTRRLGILGNRVGTLQEIAADYNVTRERIRQIENNARNKLNRKTNAEQINSLIDSSASALWENVSQEVITYEIALEAYENLSDLYKLAISLRYPKPKKWLESEFTTLHGKIIRSKISKYELTSTLRKINSEIDKRISPVRLDTLINVVGKERRVFEAALLLNDDISRFEGLLFLEGGARKSRRTARLLKILEETEKSITKHTLDIWFLYRTMFDDDPCSPRDLEIIFYSNQHLFISMGFHIWSSIKKLLSANTNLYTEAVVHSLPDCIEEEKFIELVEKRLKTAKGVRAKIYKLLREMGPSSISSIIQKNISTKGGTTGAIGADPIILRLAPGVFGLPEHVIKREYSDDVLLNIEQCKYYALNKYAGEPENSYPFWDVNYEKLLLQWARTQSPTELYHSLLFVASNSASTNEINIASNKQIDSHSIGYWELVRDPDYELEFVPFSVKTFYTLLIFCRMRKTISWLSINRCFGFRTDSRLSVWPLMMLISLGVVSPSNSWQRPHEIICGLNDWEINCNAYLEMHGQIPWESDLGQTLLSLVVDGMSRLSNSWADDNQLYKMVELIEKNADLDSMSKKLTIDSRRLDEMERDGNQKRESNPTESELFDLLGLD
jgi:hypothetical protein